MRMAGIHLSRQTQALKWGSDHRTDLIRQTSANLSNSSQALCAVNVGGRFYFIHRYRPFSRPVRMYTKRVFIFFRRQLVHFGVPRCSLLCVEVCALVKK